MVIPPFVVTASRRAWRGQWLLLMNGLAPADSGGHFRRRASGFHGQCSAQAEHHGEPRYVLIVGESCPWAHRTWLVRQLKDLTRLVRLCIVQPRPDAGRWVFAQPFEGCSQLQQLYRRAGAGSAERATVPVLWDRECGAIVNNESAELIQQLDRLPPGPDALVSTLQPRPLEGVISTWSERLQWSVNDGVYRCGFARNQQAYQQASEALFATLGELDDLLSDGRPWICGEQLSLVDVRAFPTLARWEAAYQDLFLCTQRPLWHFPHLWNWRSRFYRLSPVATTCPSETWRQHYFSSLFPLHPSGILPPALSLAKLVEMCCPQPC